MEISCSSTAAIEDLTQVEMQTSQPPPVDIGASEVEDDPVSELPVDNQDEVGCCSAAVELRMPWRRAFGRLQTMTPLSGRLHARAYQPLVRTLSLRLGSPGGRGQRCQEGLVLSGRLKTTKTRCQCVEPPESPDVSRVRGQSAMACNTRVHSATISSRCVGAGRSGPNPSMSFVVSQSLEKLRYSCGRLFRLQPTERGMVTVNRTSSRRFRLYRLSDGTKRARLFQQKRVHDLSLVLPLPLSLSLSLYPVMRVL